MGGLTGLLMAVGFAGSDWLDISLRGGLILWTVGIGLSHLAPLMPGSGRQESFSRTPRTWGSRWVHAIVGGLMTALAIVLITTDDDPMMLGRAILTLMTLAAGLAAAGLMAARRPNHRRRKASSRKEGVLL